MLVIYFKKKPVARRSLVSTSSDFETILKTSANQVLVLHFWAEWAPQCKMMEGVIEELIKDSEIRSVKFVKIEAESVPELSQQYNVTSVPTFIFLQDKKIVDRLDGADTPQLIKKVKHNASRIDSPLPPAEPAVVQEDLNTRLKKLINFSPCMLFMKGTPTEPRCGFSRQVIELLNKFNAQYSTFNILADEEVRQGLKEYSKWPTYPQLYINGELIGGLDILKELAENGELEKMLPKKVDLNQRLESLIKRAPVMVFMKGTPDTPLCGFSRTLISILNETKISYETFNILEDEEVRQGLKTYSNWPTYPQVYVNGELIGGLDIIKELKEAGELEASLKKDE